MLVTVADLAGTVARFEAAGVRASTMSGQVRLMTHADITDADIATALDRIGPVEQARPSNGGSSRARTLRAGRDRSAARPAGA